MKVAIVMIILGLIAYRRSNTEFSKIKRIFRNASLWNTRSSISIKVGDQIYVPRMEMKRVFHKPLIISECTTEKQKLFETAEICEINLIVNNHVALTKVNYFHHGRLKSTTYSKNNNYPVDDLIKVTKELRTLSNKH